MANKSKPSSKTFVADDFVFVSPVLSKKLFRVNSAVSKHTGIEGTCISDNINLKYVSLTSKTC